MPASVRCNGLQCVFQEIEKQIIPANKPPKVPTIKRVDVEQSNTMKLRTIANAAPDDTPIKLGELSGLRVIDCMMAPAMPNAAPNNIAISRRGSRNSLIIN